MFEVAAEGLVLTEIARGVDVRKDILDQMEFAPARIVDRPRTMDDALFAHYENEAAHANSLEGNGLIGRSPGRRNALVTRACGG